jgi:transposase
MMTKEKAASREQIEILSVDQLVPEEHLVRKLENAIDWNFIYELVESKYCMDNGRPSLDPVTLIKLPVLQYMFGMRTEARSGCRTSAALSRRDRASFPNTQQAPISRAIR